MAAAKELMVVAVDVGASMCGSGRKAEAVGVVQQLLLQKMMYAKKDEVAIVLFGTSATANPAATAADDGSYTNICLLRPDSSITPPTVEMVHAMNAAATPDSTASVRAGG